MDTPENDLLKVMGITAVILFIVFILGVTWMGVHDQARTEASATTYAVIPEPSNYLVDASNTLSQEQQDEFNALLKSLDNGKHQFAVLVVDTTGPLSIEQYGIEVAEKWKVGNEKLDNGAILILAVQDRKVRFEIGKGLEGDIPDSVAGAILDESVIPHFKEGNWYLGLRSGITALSARVK